MTIRQNPILALFEACHHYCTSHGISFLDLAPLVIESETPQTGHLIALYCLVVTQSQPGGERVKALNEAIEACKQFCWRVGVNPCTFVQRYDGECYDYGTPEYIAGMLLSLDIDPLECSPTDYPRPTEQFYTPTRVKTVKKKPGYVYLIQSPTGAYKIGRTSNPANRIKTFSVKLPFEVEYVCVIPTEDMHGLEAQLHALYAEQRINGEWFNLTPDNVEFIKGLAS